MPAVAARPVASLVPPTRVNSPIAKCPHCKQVVDPSLPFCAHCGSRTGFTHATGTMCTSCGTPVQVGIDLFCARCGTKVPPATAGTAVFSPKNREAGPKVALLDEEGGIARTFTIERGEAIVGRSDGDLQFSADVYLSPMHAQLSVRDGQLWVRDLGSRNGSWVFLDSPCKLQDGDLLLIGSQIIRFRRLGYPGPHPPEADSTRRMGSLTPTADIAVLEQLRSDRSVRDSFHLSPGRNAMLGRDSGDWTFPYDKTMSGKHAEIRSEDSEFYIHDAGSRNGIAIAIRGERAIKKTQRMMLGDQILRVESL